jgi:hypothetical protein
LWATHTALQEVSQSEQKLLARNRLTRRRGMAQTP